MSRSVKALLALLTLGLSSGALAGPITVQTDFTFENFTEITPFGGPVPFSTISGSVTLTFDPATEVTDQAVTSITFDDPAVPFATTGIRYTTTQVTTDFCCAPSNRFYFLDIYSTDLPVALFGEDDFNLQLAGFSSFRTREPINGRFSYSLASNSSGYIAPVTDVSSVFLTTGSVPEPQAVWLLALGLLGLATKMRLKAA